MKKFTLLIVIIFPFIVYSQTTIQEGDVSGTWTLSGSPYLIEGDITIIDTDTLAIEPDVTVEFQDYYGLFVEGYLHAIGNASDSILFTVNDTTGYHDYSHTGWKGIRFYDASENDSSYLDYCIIEYGKGYQKLGGGLYIENTNIGITNSVVQNCFINAYDEWEGGGGVTIVICSPFISNFVIRENYSGGNGGGMFIFGQDIDISDITLENNTAYFKGGGVYSTYSSITLNNFNINSNRASNGGGIYSDYDTEILLISCDILDNYAGWGGGISLSGNSEIRNSSIYNNSGTQGAGIYIGMTSSSNVIINECQIHDNSALEKGGGLYITRTYETLLKNSSFYSNSAKYGGGIYMGHKSTKLENLSITNNNGYYGGGIYFYSNTPIALQMDSVNLCSIYLNNGKVGKDLLSRASGIEIRVDTFTVQNPSDYYAIPATNFSFNIANGLDSLINEDFYVSPDGSDQNSGLSISDPFKTIDHALSVLYTDDQNPATIYLDNGIYSPSLTGETYPLTLHNNLSLLGSNNSILDADSTDRIISSFGANTQTIKNLILKNGKTEYNGAGIHMEYSTAQLDSINISNCESDDHGGGMYLIYDSVEVSNITISNCNAKYGGGIRASQSYFMLSNAVIKENVAVKQGGGISLYTYYGTSKLNNVIVSNNQATKGGGIVTGFFPELSKVSVFENSASEYGGGIYISNRAPIFDSINRSSIYLNSAPIGNDLYNRLDSIIHVFADTFTVLHPTAYHAAPLNLFTFDINNGITGQISDNIYVSTIGDDNNSGLSWSEPLKTIKHGLSVAYSSESQPITFHLADGTYSEESTGEYLPILPIDYNKFLGYDEVIIDANTQSSVIVIEDLQGVELDNLIIQNGNSIIGGGINFKNSEAKLFNLFLSNNTATLGGGINIESSHVEIYNSIINNNYASQTGGIYAYQSQLQIIGSQITGNSDESITGGLGLYRTNADVVNSTFSENTTNEYRSGEISAYDLVNLEITNCIFWGSIYNWDIYMTGYFDPAYLTISNSSLTEGESSIGTYGNTVINYDLSNISGDPRFLGYGDYPYQLDEYSPCINTGSLDTTGLNLPPQDLAGNPRIFNGRIEMGAFEWGPFVGVEDHNLYKEESEFIIYPNPTKGHITISSKGELNINKITIYNQLGQKVLHKTHSTNSIDVSKLQNGIYIIEIAAGEIKIREKLIIQ